MLVILPRTAGVVFRHFTDAAQLTQDPGPRTGGAMGFFAADRGFRPVALTLLE